MDPGGFALARHLVLAVAIATFLGAIPCHAAADASLSDPAAPGDAPPGPPSPDAAPTPARFQLRVKGLVGLGTPYGQAGGELELAGRIFSLAVGAGAGTSGAQYAGMLRARAQGRLFFIDAGVGLASGAFSRDTLYICITGCANREPAPVHTALWTNLELGGGVQVRWFHLRPFLGVASLNNPGTFGETRVTLPYVGLSMGLSLPL
jgi:hypothetical protein